MKRKWAFLVGCLWVQLSLAQHKVIADKIVGIVGDKIILRSDVYNEIQDRQRRNEPIPENAPCFAFDQLLIIKADRKSTRLNSSHSQQSRMPSSA